MKLFHKFLIGLGLFTTVLTACTKDFEEINTNPNDPTQVPTVSLALSASRVLLDELRDEWAAGRMVQPWMQYWAQVNYTEEDRFQYRENSNASMFKAIYTTLTDFQRIIEIAEDPELKNLYSEAYGNANNQIQAARIMKVWGFQLLTDMYGPIPYSSYGSDNPDFNALMAHKGILNPTYVTQELIYKDLLAELEDAAAKLETTEAVFDRDIIFTDETAQHWKQFANSLRLRIAVQAQGKLAEADAAITALKDSPDLIMTNSHNAFWNYDGSTLKGAPMYKAYFVGNRTDFAVSKQFIDLLKGQPSTSGRANPFDKVTDPRLFKYAVSVSIAEKDFIAGKVIESKDPVVYEGVPYGVTNEVAGGIALSRISLPGVQVLAANAPGIYMEAAEVYFLLSEVHNYDATYYEKGIRASMEKWGVETAEIDTYLAALPDFTVLSAEQKKEALFTQKYIALYMQPHQAWSEYKRTAYPKTLIKPTEFTGANYKTVLNAEGKEETVIELSSVPLGDEGDKYFKPLISDVNDVPARVNFPIEEKDLNPNGYAEGQSLVGKDHQSTTLWIFE